MANKAENLVVQGVDNSLWEAFRTGDFTRLERIAEDAGLSRESLKAAYFGFIKDLATGYVDYTPVTAKTFYSAAELASRYELPKAAELYERIIKAHEDVGRPEAAARVRMVAGLTQEDRKNYIELRRNGKLPILS